AAIRRGPLLAGWIPGTRGRAITWGLPAASATVPLNLVTTPSGVVAGAIRPTQPIALYFGCPASAMVGTWGREGDRASPLTASALTDPPSMNGIIPPIGPK